MDPKGVQICCGSEILEQRISILRCCPKSASKNVSGSLIWVTRMDILSDIAFQNSPRIDSIR